MFRRVCTCPSPGLTVVLLRAAPEFAAGISPVDSTAAGEGGYLAPTSGQNPHGGYSAATNKCKGAMRSTGRRYRGTPSCVPNASTPWLSTSPAWPRARHAASSVSRRALRSHRPASSPSPPPVSGQQPVRGQQLRALRVLPCLRPLRHHQGLRGRPREVPHGIGGAGLREQPRLQPRVRHVTGHCETGPAM